MPTGVTLGELLKRKAGEGVRVLIVRTAQFTLGLGEIID